jgi:hypothetical protein
VKRTDQIEMRYKPLRAAMNAAGITTPDRQPYPWVLSPDLPMYIEGSATRKAHGRAGRDHFPQPSGDDHALPQRT